MVVETTLYQNGESRVEERPRCFNLKCQLWLEAEVSRYVVPDPRHGTGAPDSTIAVLCVPATPARDVLLSNLEFLRNQGGKANGGGPGLIVSPAARRAIMLRRDRHDGTSQRKS
ncbi:hypothetical protein CTAM01_05206 [Colletotrichum tamarilloi]|uniref:Uncharacterized protein n=1 Tax=Colletotrichum tamarilloi TaxID=1209934 RepID=A0ABQ9RFN1_9PEZI|nr:uncharacterized protein CTAM01_05206 [Colletotrichum tamarilloi]KAK1502393.1 hypothetical protein CTAM01_05206 [Colletotrichum tamarilloi]